MIAAARILRMLAIAVWLGSIVFFGAVVAPTAFRVFGPQQTFAEFIARTILMLHSIGLWCGVALLVSLRLLGARAYRQLLQCGLVLLMIVLTYASTRLIVLPMEHDRMMAGGDINILMQGSPLRDDFDARHAWSTRIEGVVILAGIGLVVLMGLERERVPALPARKVFDLSSDD